MIECASAIFSIVVESMTVLADDGFEDDWKVNENKK